MPVHRFDGYTLDTDQYRLTGPEGPVDMEPQVFDVLAHLVAHAGDLVSKEQLLDEVWGDRFVSESALTSRIAAARRAVGDDGRRQDRIATVHGRGYRFVAELDEPAGDPSPPDGGGCPSTGQPMDGDGPPTAGATEWPSPRLLPPELRPDNRRVFVGRRDEMDRALAASSVADRSTPAVVWLLGAPGIGKTRLAARIANVAHESGARVLFGRSSEDLTVPYEPFVTALRGHLRDTPEAATPTLGPAPHELARLEPSVVGRHPDGSRVGPTAADPDTERFRLFDAVAGWLGALASVGPLVVVLDDMHWADGSSVQLLRHLVQSLRAGPTTFLVTARDTGPDDNPVLSDLIAEIDDSGASTVIELAGLDHDSVRRLLPEGGDVDRVMAETAGNPLLVQAVTQGSGAAGSDVRLAVRRRLSNLSGRVRDTLGVAAIAGLEFDVRVLAVAGGSSELELIADLEAAVGARLLDEVDRDTFRFSHALVRDSLRGEVGEARRARVHQALAEAISEIHADDLDAQAPRLALHHLAAGGDGHDRRQAIHYSVVAGRQAHDLLSFPDAVGHFDTALGLLDGPGPDTRRRAEVLLAKGTTRARAGLHLPALGTLRSAFDAAVEAGDDDTIIEAALAYEDARWRPGLHGGPALPLLETADEVVDDQDIGRRAAIAIATARALMYTGDKEAADRGFAQAEALVEKAGDPAIEATYLAALLLPVVADQPDGYLDRTTRLMELGEELDSTEHLLMAEQFRIRELLRQGRGDEALQTQRTMAVRTREQRSSFWDYVTATHEASFALFQGDLERAERGADQVLAIATTLPGEDTTGIHGFQMFLIRREQDRLGPLAPVLRRLVADQPEGGLWDPGLGVFLADIGDLEGAGRSFERLASGGFAVNEVDAMWPAIMAFAVELAVELDDGPRGEQLYRRLSSLSGTFLIVGHNVANLGSADRFLGMAAMAAGDLERAGRHLDLAIEADESGGSALWAGHSRLQKARLLDRLGQTDGAAELAREVSSTARAAGHHALARRADALTD